MKAGSHVPESLRPAGTKQSGVDGGVCHTHRPSGQSNVGSFHIIPIAMYLHNIYTQNQNSVTN